MLLHIRTHFTFLSLIETQGIVAVISSMIVSRFPLVMQMEDYWICLRGFVVYRMYAVMLASCLQWFASCMSSAERIC